MNNDERNPLPMERAVSMGFVGPLYCLAQGSSAPFQSEICRGKPESHNSIPQNDCGFAKGGSNGSCGRDTDSNRRHHKQIEFRIAQNQGGSLKGPSRSFFSGGYFKLLPNVTTHADRTAVPNVLSSYQSPDDVGPLEVLRFDTGRSGTPIPIHRDLRRKRRTVKPEFRADTFKWLENWYPVFFEEDLPEGKPVSFTLFDEPRVLFRDEKGVPRCLEDICPHRGVPLSAGRVVGGQIECGYHGWQFNGTGACTRIPQMPEGRPIPRRACGRSFQVEVRQGMIWVWADSESRGDVGSIPTSPAIDDPQFPEVDNYTRDLPYDYATQVENVLDAAHVHFVHHGFQGSRKKASHLEIKKWEKEELRCKAEFKHVGVRAPDIDMEWRAPTLIEVTIHLPPGVGKNLIYVTPTGKGRCRILFRNARNFLVGLMVLSPRWWQHFTVSSIADQDVLAIYEQDRLLSQSDDAWRQYYYMPTTSDRLVLEFRKWFELTSRTMPGRHLPPAPVEGDAAGDATKSKPSLSTSLSSSTRSRQLSKEEVIDRFNTHVLHCTSCSAALTRITILRKLALTVAFSSISFAALNPYIPTELGPEVGLWVPLKIAVAAAFAFNILVSIEKRFHYFPTDFNKRP